MRRRTVAAAAVATAGALVLGVLGFPTPARAAGDAEDCLVFWHTVGIRTQTHYGKNECDSGTYGFQIYSWSKISAETSDCIWVDPGETDGWKWTKGRGNYRVYYC